MKWSVKMWNGKCDDMRKILSASWSWKEFIEFLSASVSPNKPLQHAHILLWRVKHSRLYLHLQNTIPEWSSMLPQFDNNDEYYQRKILELNWLSDNFENLFYVKLLRCGYGCRYQADNRSHIGWALAAPDGSSNRRTAQGCHCYQDGKAVVVQVTYPWALISFLFWREGGASWKVSFTYMLTF